MNIPSFSTSESIILFGIFYSNFEEGISTDFLARRSGEDNDELKTKSKNYLKK